MNSFFIAHTPNQPGGESHDLRQHLTDVAQLAASFGSAFGAEAWARLAGLWHDLGKYQPAFQDYLQGDAQVSHSIVGAAYAARLGEKIQQPQLPLPLVMVIAGHHGGLPNPVRRDESPGRPLKERLDDPAAAQQLDAALSEAPADLLEHELPPLPSWLSLDPATTKKEHEKLLRRCEMWIRFLFSTLVDADFLDTDRFHKPDHPDLRRGGYTSIPELRQRLDTHIADLVANAKSNKVNTLRAEVLASCSANAEKPPGIFSLNVPTGGGKTLSSMAFALRHAERHGLRRVIVVVPFNSIIEQNAAVYKDALGKENLIEHHSSLDPEKDKTDPKYATWRDLASENWDAPIIVTTAVQFFESLFANRTSRCRKLHRIAQSVVLLDEVQTLPPGFLHPILEGLETLRRDFGTTLVLSTATQPALEKSDLLQEGLSEVEPIIENPHELARRLKRVKVCWPDLEAPALEWQKLAEELLEHQQVMAIVHRRADARALAELLPEEGRFHLSGLMCAAHRSQVLAEVKRALTDGKPCRLISTQLVEAGVDVDFPVVYRALGPLDSIIQAAGRCNREGRLPDLGQLVVYRAPTAPPPGVPKLGLQVLETLLDEQGGTLDISDPEIAHNYFEHLYGNLERDKKSISTHRSKLDFATVGWKFRLIPDAGHSIVVPYGKSAKHLNQLRQVEPGRGLRAALRGIQPYLVNIYDRDFRRLEADGALECVQDGVFALSPPYLGLYDPDLGLDLGEERAADPGGLLV